MKMTQPDAGLRSIPALIARNAATHRDRPAYREKEFGIWQSWTWSQSLDEIRALALGLLDTLLRAGIILALPMIVPMLLIEMGLVVATKYIPQLNAMFLAMSIKQALFVILMVAYAALLARYAMGMLDDAALSAGALRPFLDALR